MNLPCHSGEVACNHKRLPSTLVGLPAVTSSHVAVLITEATRRSASACVYVFRRCGAVHMFCGASFIVQYCHASDIESSNLPCHSGEVVRNHKRLPSTLVELPVAISLHVVVLITEATQRSASACVYVLCHAPFILLSATSQVESMHSKRRNPHNRKRVPSTLVSTHRTLRFRI